MSIIYPKFYSLDLEKRERIINAALKEFTRNGYEKASTNEIIREADIAKGSLFTYFINKKGLYLFLLDYVVEIINQIYDEIDFNETDFFKRIKEVGLIKFKIMKRYPLAFDFLKTADKEDAAEVKSEIEKLRSNTIEFGFQRGYKNIDWTKFREDIDLQKMLNMINWILLSFAEQQRDRISSFRDISMEVFKEWDEYFDIMKICFYKKGEE